MVGGNDDDNAGGRVGGSDCSWAERTDPILDLVSDLYSVHKISVGGSRLSSCPTYTVY